MQELQTEIIINGASERELSTRSADSIDDEPLAAFVTDGLRKFRETIEIEQPLSAAGAVSPPRVWDCHAGKQYPADAVYVGCKVSMYGRTIREGSIFGNGANPLVSHRASFKTEREFRDYATKRLTDPEFRVEVEKLRGKHLLCWCVQDGPKRAEFCHARIWLELANSEGHPAIADVIAEGTARGLLRPSITLSVM